MTRGNEIISAMKWLATMGLALLLPAAHATTAVVFSESTGRYGVAWNEPGKEEAIKKATEDCRYRGGGKDCKPVKISDTPGFGTVAQTCAGGFCGISIITGRRSAADAERDAVHDCNANYGTRDCRAYDNWEERGRATSQTTPSRQESPVATKNSGNSHLRLELSNEELETLVRSADGGDQQALDKLTSAANSGSINAQRKLGQLYIYGGKGLKKDSRLALRYLQKAADQGDKGAAKTIQDQRMLENLP